MAIDQKVRVQALVRIVGMIAHAKLVRTVGDLITLWVTYQKVGFQALSTTKMGLATAGSLSKVINRPHFRCTAS